VTAELVHTTVELANRQVEAAQLRRALASRVWIEQANPARRGWSRFLPCLAAVVAGRDPGEDPARGGRPPSLRP
jgi:hypothetical protein